MIGYRLSVIGYQRKSYTLDCFNSRYVSSHPNGTPERGNDKTSYKKKRKICSGCSNLPIAIIKTQWEPSQIQGVEERGMRRSLLYAAVTSDEDNDADGAF